MKKVMLKKWLNNLLMGVATISFLLIVVTIESQWTIEYLQFVGVNVILFGASALILAKWGRPIEEE